MIKQRIIATKISITKQGEIKFFQVKIPFDAKVITGIETAMRLKTFTVFPTLLVPVPMVDNPYGNIVASGGAGFSPDPFGSPGGNKKGTSPFFMGAVPFCGDNGIRTINFCVIFNIHVCLSGFSESKSTFERSYSSKLAFI